MYHRESVRQNSQPARRVRLDDATCRCSRHVCSHGRQVRVSLRSGQYSGSGVAPGIPRAIALAAPPFASRRFRVAKRRPRPAVCTPPAVVAPVRMVEPTTTYARLVAADKMRRRLNPLPSKLTPVGSKRRCGEGWILVLPPPARLRLARNLRSVSGRTVGVT